ncbi:MAG: AAA family ATPase [Nanoarchaeota archaeon]
MGKVIGIVSLKGGVGKTSVVSSLGAAIADLGKKVLLVDGNLSAPNLGLHFNIVNPEATLHHVFDRSVNIRKTIHELEKFDLIPASLSYKGNINPLKLKDNISQLKREYDIILIDSSPTLNDETLAVMLASDAVIVVTTPDIPTLSTTIKAIKLAKQRGTPIYGLILNKIHNKDFELSIGDIERTSNVPVLAIIPHDVNVLRSLSEFKPYSTYKPKSDGSIEFKKLASTLLGERYSQRKFKDFFYNSTPKRSEINREIFYDRIFG